MVENSKPQGTKQSLVAHATKSSKEKSNSAIAKSSKSKSVINLSSQIKVDYAGLLAKVVRKLAKRGKHAKGEDTLLKALKKVDLSIKKNRSNVAVGFAQKVSLINNPKVGLAGKPLNLVHSVLPTTGKGLSLRVGQAKAVSESKQGSSSAGRKTGVSSKDTLLALLANIIQKAKPLVRLKKVRVAGITHQKPIPLTKKQAETEAIKRILVNAKTRSEKSASVRLAKEFEEIYNLSLSNKTLTEIRDLHKAADANKANLGLK